MDDLYRPAPTTATATPATAAGPEPGEIGSGDADLVAQVRDGLDEPYAELYRRHQPAALALARTLTEHSAADDVVSEAFEKLLQRIRGGGGPEAAFRPYLLRTVRTVAVDASRRTRRLVVSEDPEEAAGTAPVEDDELVDAIHERTTLARAFAALPERWQTFLWLSFVDDADRAETARILGINVGSVSALGYRAREGLRRAYLDAHLRDAPTPECAEVWPLLAGAVRGGLGPSQQAEVDEHTADCEHCRAAVAELEAVNTRFGAVLAPIVLGAAAPAYLAAVQHGGAGASAAGAATSAAAEARRRGRGRRPVVAPGSRLRAEGDAGRTGQDRCRGRRRRGVRLDRRPGRAAGRVHRPAGLRALGAAPAGHDRRPTGPTAPGARAPTARAAKRSPTDVSYGTGSTPGDPTSPTESGDPTTTGTPTASPTGGPTGTPTATPTGSHDRPSARPRGPTAGPTTGPTTGPTIGPTSRSHLRPDAGDRSHASTPTATASADPRHAHGDRPATRRPRRPRRARSTPPSRAWSCSRGARPARRRTSSSR